MVPPLGSQALKALTPTAVSVDRSRCVRHRCSRNDCRQCLDVCPSGAVTWGTQGLRVDPDTCTQCLRCLSVCPTAALQSPEISLPQIVADLAAHRQPVLACHRQSASEAHARLPCLGYLAHGEVLPLLALTQPGGVQVDLSSCCDCPNGHIVAAVGEAHARLSDLRPGHGVRLVHDRDDLAFEPPALSRRDLFVFFREHSRRTAAVMAKRLQPEADTRSYGNKRVPVPRAMLRKALDRLSERERGRIADRLFGRIAFTPACDACGGCVGVCPTAAIRPAADGGLLPRFDPTLCVTCRSCEAFCAKCAVTVADGGVSQSTASGRWQATIDERRVG